MLALPSGAADTGPLSGRPNGFGAGCPGMNGCKCAPAQMGPTPGPPPPCGMQNVLCRLRCTTSAPMSPGRHRPTCAFMFAPSM